MNAPKDCHHRISEQSSGRVLSNGSSLEETSRQALATNSTLLGFGFSRTCSDLHKQKEKRSLLIKIPKHVYQKAICDPNPARRGAIRTPNASYDCSSEEFVEESSQNTFTKHQGRVGERKSHCLYTNTLKLILAPSREKQKAKRIHPFFNAKYLEPQSGNINDVAKEATCTKPKAVRKLSEAVATNAALPTYDNMHVRQWNYDHASKRRKTLSKGKLSQQTIESSPDFLSGLWDRSSKAEPLGSRFPTRMLLPIGSKIDYLSKTRNIQSLKDTTLYESLLRANRYDVGSFENQMWCDKYAPKKVKDLLQYKDTGIKIRDWLSAVHYRQYEKGPFGKHIDMKSETKNDFIVYGDENEEGLHSDMPDFETFPDYTQRQSCLLAGPVGSCKTAAAVAVANELGFEILEMNAGNRRSAKDVFEQVGENSRNKLVNSEKSLILLEEVDIVFEQDKNFWVAVEELIRITLRPVVMTTNDLSRIPENLCSKCIVFTFDTFEHNVLAEYLISVALSEGHSIQRAEVDLMIMLRKKDLRGCLADLQFRCQMGIGDRRGGLDWVVPWSTTSGMRTHVIAVEPSSKSVEWKPRGLSSQETLLSNMSKEVKLRPRLSQIHRKIEDFLSFSETMSYLDAYIDNQFSPYSTPIAVTAISSDATEAAYFSDMELRPNDNLVHEYAKLSQLNEQENISSTILAVLLGGIDIEAESSATKSIFADEILRPTTKIVPLDIKNALTSINVRSNQCQYKQKESRGWDFPDEVLAADIAPLVRCIARSDNLNEETRRFCMNRHQAGGNRRITRRALSTVFPHLRPKYLGGDYSKILATADPSWV